ncbi:hypothetical protein Cme02nite_47740 [Catellatospora methionotrophica]|uniref:DUF998 domain-containing protein n=1 Tax=Catellatospora methionotrophica TaxID=121620 RepID=A0A8J3PGL8_9ACTN|nr:DUF998 domain-containing protein [Catellatospora methionotrophica]GIG16442.1 hypothetical protein Cme02nite_47740 [Catellatospora methionotrophica]
MRQRLGALCWMLTIVYFLVQPFVAAAWDPAYSFSANTISDLGYARCEPSADVWRQATMLCSPRHALMNAAFVLVGVCTAVGALATRRYWPPQRLAGAGLALIAVSGVGAVLVGLAPGDVNMPLHLVGAGLQFPGALGPLLVGLATPRERRRERAFSLAMGVVGIVGCVLFASGQHLGLGVGGAERLGFDPLTVWTVVLGVIVWRARPAGNHSPS